MTLPAATYLDHIRKGSSRLARAYEAAPDAPVPTCPKWDVGRLVSHLGRVHRWVAEIAETRATAPVAFHTWPPEGTDMAAWLREGSETLVAALGALEPGAPIWNHINQPHSAMFWTRRQAQETAIHAWDGENAVEMSGGAAAHPIDADLAGDGVAEMIENMVVPLTAGREVGTGETIHLHAADADCEWVLTLGAGGVTAEWGHLKADAAVKGNASDLLLWIWNRRRAGEGSLEARGDDSLLARWPKIASF